MIRRSVRFCGKLVWFGLEFGAISQVEPIGLTSEPRHFSWERIPLPVSEGLSIEINPQDSDEIFAVLQAEGIYRSINGGIDWRPVREEASVEGLHIAPANSSIIYAGAFARVLKSEDGVKPGTVRLFRPDPKCTTLSPIPTALISSLL